jgi:hypothetical protein
MGDHGLKFILAYVLVILVLVLGALIQNWWDARKP